MEGVRIIRARKCWRKVGWREGKADLQCGVVLRVFLAQELEAIHLRPARDVLVHQHLDLPAEVLTLCLLPQAAAPCTLPVRKARQQSAQCRSWP